MKIYYDATIHYGVVNNCCYDTRERSFSTLEEMLSWANKNWSHGEIKMENLDLSEGKYEIYSNWIKSKGGTDLILLRRMNSNWVKSKCGMT